MRPVLDDLRFSFRLLRKQPAFALLVTACLALGIGANASIFSLLNALLLRTLPVPDAGRLVALHRGRASRFAFLDYQDLASRFQNSANLLATLPTESSLDRAGYQGQLVTAEAVTGNYARVLQVGTALGDWFDSEDAPVAVISYRAWQDLFRGDPRVLGQQIRSETQWYTVVGIAPKNFTGLAPPKSTSVWVPLHIWARQHPNMQATLQDRNGSLLLVFGRLSRGIKESAAAAQLRTIDAQLARETFRTTASHHALTVETVRGITASEDRTTAQTILALLFGVVGAFLLICCVNIGNLLLVRGATRQREIAIRYSLGAPRSRILRQLLADSLLLAFCGGLAGLGVNALMVRLILRLVPALPLGENISPDVPLDWNVIGFLAASTLLSVFLFGLLPAWKASSPDLSATIKTSLTTRPGVRLRRLTVVAQVVLSFVLLVVAGLFLDACWRLQRVDPGFDVRGRLYATTYISKPEFTREQIPAFYQQVLSNLAATPNVRSAGLTYLLPLGAPETECVKTSASSEIEVTTSTISPGFLRTMNIPLLQGRDFDNSDQPNTPQVVLINQALAEKLWPYTSPVGHQIQLGCREPSRAIVVGVVNNSKTLSLSQGFRPHVYLAFAQNATGLATIVIETSGSSGSLAEFRRNLLNQGHGMRVYAVNRLSEHLEQSYWQLRWESWLLGAFGLAALLLAIIGLYGVTSYSTALRRKEFGLRMALGAQPGDILRLVMKEGFAMGLVGVCLGSITALALTAFLSNYLLKAPASVPLTCLGVAVLWLMVLMGACYPAARRSSHVEPSTALRYD